MPTPVIAIFDVGKTNKKLFLFDRHYRVVFERSARFLETIDEDGEPCENLESLRLSVFDSLREVFRLPQFEIKAINFTSYGASLVYIDSTGTPLTPLYNYLKPYPAELQKKFYDSYGGEEAVAHATASPVLGSLNSGMQLYRLQQERPAVYAQVQFALHFPQYLSYLITGVPASDLTSIGCHTNLWDFGRGQYHEWVYREGIHEKLAPILPATHTLPAAFPGTGYPVGLGLHDSSAALIPYLVNFTEPFVLISTGTWCITLNPFNDQPLTTEELQQDCLCFLSYTGQPVKAARLFAGNTHEQEVKRIAAHFGDTSAFYRQLSFDPGIIHQLLSEEKTGIMPVDTKQMELEEYATGTIAYHALMLKIARQQYHSAQLVLKDCPVKRIFVDGGFSANQLYMHLLAAFFPALEVFAASMPQATALGTALAIHDAWNDLPMPADMIGLTLYRAPQAIPGLLPVS